VIGIGGKSADGENVIMAGKERKRVVKRVRREKEEGKQTGIGEMAGDGGMERDGGDGSLILMISVQCTVEL
jgi:hypothetical protein